MILSWRTLHRSSVPALIRKLAARHPELVSPVTWPDVETICRRERVIIQVLALHQPERLVRIGRVVVLQIDRRLALAARAVWAMHGLCHFWRDDPGEMCYYGNEDSSMDPREQFADVFAWAVTSPARAEIPGLRPSDFPNPIHGADE